MLPRVAIFNSLPFHYEVFGYIIHFAESNGYHIDIYTQHMNTLGWFDFYSCVFKQFSLLPYTSFKKEGYEYIFVTTDDDPRFKQEWVSDNVIGIHHTNKIRKVYTRCINLAKFIDSPFEHSIPCYPYINEKTQTPSVCIIGNCNYKYDVINQLQSIYPIQLYIFKRKDIMILWGQ